MFGSDNTQAPFFGPGLPLYPKLEQAFRVTGPPVAGAAVTGVLQPAVLTQCDTRAGVPVMRGRNQAWVLEPNGIPAPPGWNGTGRVVGAYPPGDGGIPVVAFSLACCRVQPSFASPSAVSVSSSLSSPSSRSPPSSRLVSPSARSPAPSPSARSPSPVSAVSPRSPSPVSPPSSPSPAASPAPSPSPSSPPSPAPSPSALSSPSAPSRPSPVSPASSPFSPPSPVSRPSPVSPAPSPSAAVSSSPSSSSSSPPSVSSSPLPASPPSSPPSPVSPSSPSPRPSSPVSSPSSRLPSSSSSSPCVNQPCCPRCLPETLFVTFQNISGCPSLAGAVVRIVYSPTNGLWSGCSISAIPGVGGSGILCVSLRCAGDFDPESSCYNHTSWQLSFTCQGNFTDTQTDNPPNPCTCGPSVFGPGIFLTWVTIPVGINDVCCPGGTVTATVTE